MLASGSPSTKPDHHGVPFSMTEDFVTIYRPHLLIPDDYRFLDHKTGELLHTRTFPEISGTHAGPELRSVGLENAMYSLGLAHPGAIRLNNFPNSLLEFEHGDGQVNLGVVDIVRSRRRGVPRYNDFRAGLHKPRVTDWEELSTPQGSGSHSGGV